MNSIVEADSSEIRSGRTSGRAFGRERRARRPVRLGGVCRSDALQSRAQTHARHPAAVACGGGELVAIAGAREPAPRHALTSSAARRRRCVRVRRRYRYGCARRAHESSERELLVQSRVQRAAGQQRLELRRVEECLRSSRAARPERKQQLRSAVNQLQSTCAVNY